MLNNHGARRRQRFFIEDLSIIVFWGLSKVELVE